MVKRCVAAGCSNTNADGVSLFKFPKDEKLCAQWIKQVKGSERNGLVRLTRCCVASISAKNASNQHQNLQQSLE